MKVIIVEDEKHARENLEQLLLSLNPSIEILAQMDSVSKTVAWLKEHRADLIFLDIHLADDLSFSIFEQVEVKTPIIFTTAYDQYAVRAFKVNSVDYLLKPIDIDELSRALEKYGELQQHVAIDYQKLSQALGRKDQPTYQKRFIVQRGEKVMSVKLEDVAYFEGEDRYVFLTKRDGSRFIVDYKLADLEDMLDPAVFFRLNRSFLAHFDAIENIFTVSKSRMKVSLSPRNKREIIVSSENTRRFKLWLNA